MEWKVAALFIILTALFIPSPLRRILPKDLLFLIGGALTLLLGIVSARQFAQVLTSTTLLGTLLLFGLAYAFKEPLFDREIRIRSIKDALSHLPEDFWIYALSGLLFAAAF